MSFRLKKLSVAWPKMKANLWVTLWSGKFKFPHPWKWYWYQIYKTCTNHIWRYFFFHYFLFFFTTGVGMSYLVKMITRRKSRMRKTGKWTPVFEEDQELKKTGNWKPVRWRDLPRLPPKVFYYACHNAILKRQRLEVSYSSGSARRSTLSVPR